MIKEIKDISFMLVGSEIEAFLLEANLIKKYKPFYNIKMADDKFFPFIMISRDEIPYVSITRKTNEKNAFYFGPYTDSSSLKVVLKIIRKIFPFQSVKNHPKKKCLYNHLGLCPCLNIFPEKKEEYKKNIKRLRQFLRGNSSKIIYDLKHERDALSKTERFEEAKNIQEKINKINQITNNNYSILAYDKNSNYFFEKTQNEVAALKKMLLNFFKEIDSLKRIECYDVSNIQGKFATGSMVVFLNGISQKSEYRRFKIRSQNSPNDFAMIKEIVRRRLKHEEWGHPNLMVIDGGRGQVRYAEEALREIKATIPIIGLAKENEEIIIPYLKTGKKFYLTKKLPLSNPEVNLLRKIRDEAHRFAIAYHRKIRNKMFFDRS